MNQTNVTNCPSCGDVITENFCANCGEKKRSLHDLTMKHFVEESVEGISHFDGRFFRTIKLLFTKPGLLTQHFEEGRRVPYMKPFQLFIVANLVFFLVAHGPNLFATPLNTFYNNPNKTFNTRKAIQQKLNVTSDAEIVKYPKEFLALKLSFNEKMVTQSKVYILLFIPLLAVGCALLFYRKKKFLSLHLSFASHFFSFVLLYFILFFILIELPAHYIFHVTGTEAYDRFLGITSITTFVIYLVFATRKFYKVRVTWSIISSITIAGLFLLALQAYRLLLFYKIIHTI